MKYDGKSKEQQDGAGLEDVWVAYQTEMDGILCTKGLKETALERASASSKNAPGNIRHGHMRWAAAAAAVLLCLAWPGNGGRIVGFAESLIHSFILVAGNRTMELDAIEPLAFDIEAFLADPGTHKTEGLENAAEGTKDSSYYQFFDTYKEMNRLTGMEFPNADVIEYSEIMLDVDVEQRTGHLCTEVRDGEIKFSMNGMFTIEGYHSGEWGYGVQRKPQETFAYADGKYAYFTSDSEYQESGMEVVYFSEGNIMFQLFLDKKKQTREDVQQFLRDYSRDMPGKP